jgi:HTH-type transcriptional regulator/antitoxin MqsA
MKCPTCGMATLLQDTRDLVHSYQGHSTMLPAVTGEYCSNCGEQLLGPEESQRTMELMLAFKRSINAALIDPEFIVRVRKKLKLDQRQAAEFFGGGVNAFSRYESGKMRPPLALVKLLKLLDRHPELLSEM